MKPQPVATHDFPALCRTQSPDVTRQAIALYYIRRHNVDQTMQRKQIHLNLCLSLILKTDKKVGIWSTLRLMRHSHIDVQFLFVFYTTTWPTIVNFLLQVELETTNADVT